MQTIETSELTNIRVTLFLDKEFEMTEAMTLKDKRCNFGSTERRFKTFSLRVKTGKWQSTVYYIILKRFYKTAFLRNVLLNQNHTN